MGCEERRKAQFPIKPRQWCSLGVTLPRPMRATVLLALAASACGGSVGRIGSVRPAKDDGERAEPRVKLSCGVKPRIKLRKSLEVLPPPPLPVSARPATSAISSLSRAAASLTATALTAAALTAAALTATALTALRRSARRSRSAPSTRCARRRRTWRRRGTTRGSAASSRSETSPRSSGARPGSSRASPTPPHASRCALGS